MRTKECRRLSESLIVDIDGVIAHQARPIEDRHSAAASAAILTARLLGGAFVNLARIANALERLADTADDLIPEDQDDE